VTTFFATRQCLGGIEAFLELNSRYASVAPMAIPNTDDYG
jgi:hypothetical protein